MRPLAALACLLPLASGCSAAPTKLEARVAALSKRVDELAPTRIGVVDVSKLFGGYVRKDEFEREVNAEFSSAKATVADEFKAIAEQRRRLDERKAELPPQEYEAEAQRIEALEREAFTRTKRRQATLKRHVERLTLQMLDEIAEAVRVYGKWRSFTLILKVDSGRPAKEGTNAEDPKRFQEEIFRAQVSNVLYRDARAVDVTKPVLTYLNSPQFQRRLERRAPKTGAKTRPR